MTAMTATCLGILFVASCSERVNEELQRMVDQRRCTPGQTTDQLDNGSCNQTPPSGTVSYQAASDLPSNTGRTRQGETLAESPLPVTRERIEYGRKRFDVYCAPCHGLIGDGETQVSENMLLRKPPAIFSDRVQHLTDGQIFRVISHGFGLMPSYARSLDPEARWAVIAYVRVLGLSQRVSLSELSPELQKEAEPWLR